MKSSKKNEAKLFEQKFRQILYGYQKAKEENEITISYQVTCYSQRVNSLETKRRHAYHSQAADNAQP